MAITNIPTRTSSDTNSSADVNTLNANDQDLQTQISGISVTETSTTKSANFIIADDDGIYTFLVTTAADTITATLPTAADNTDRVIEILKVDSGTGKITVDGEGAETINGVATIDIPYQYMGMRIKCNGTNWIVLDYLPASEFSSKIEIVSANTNIGTGVTVVQTFTAPVKGKYRIEAFYTFDNGQSDADSVRYVAMYLRKGGSTQLSESREGIINQGASTEFANISLFWEGELTASQTMETIAYCSSDGIARVYASGDTSGWVVTHLGWSGTLA